MRKYISFLLVAMSISMTGCSLSRPVQHVSVSSPAAQQPAAQPAQQGDTPRTMIGLLKRGGNYSCAFTEDLASQKTMGWFYISGERASGGATRFPKNSHESSNTTFIRNSDFTYVWANNLTNAPKTGIKTKSVPIENTKMPPGSSVDFSHDTTFTCAPWKQVDERVFVPPAVVSFTDAQ